MPGLRLFARGSDAERRRLAEVLRAETVGGALLVLAAAVAMVWANSGAWPAYEDLRETTFGPAALDLHLPLHAWASDGLLAVFFFVAGLELKRELVAGDLRDPRVAALPAAAAVGGMVVPALLYVLVNVVAADGDARGWAIPSATDVAFALAVLAVIGRGLPVALRTFLLTLAVVDDLLAIVIIAVFFTEGLDLALVVLALVPIAVFGALVQRRVTAGWLLVPLALAAWTAMHASGVHATVAAVLLAFTVPVARGGLAQAFEHRLRPLSAGVAVPVFALLAAGVHVGGADGLGDALSDPVAVGVIVGLVVGKPLGILLAAWTVARVTRAELDPALSWPDVASLGLLAGIGFTGSLLAVASAAAGLHLRRRAHARA